MPVLSKILDLFCDYGPDREKRKRLQKAELDLVVAEHDLEMLTAHVPMLKSRIERLNSELKGNEPESRPARSSIQAPHPGQRAPDRSVAGGWTLPDAPMRGRGQTASA
jgi:hypothetical protein